MIYQVRENKLHQVCERETKGSVFCLAAFQVSPELILEDYRHMLDVVVSCCAAGQMQDTARLIV